MNTAPFIEEVVFFGATISFQIRDPGTSVTNAFHGGSNGGKSNLGFSPKAKMPVKGARVSQKIDK